MDSSIPHYPIHRISVFQENDYNLTYFDNGEDYIGFEDEDGLDDGGAYY